MFAYRRSITIEDPKRTILTDLPFRPGQRVEVVMIEDERDSSVRLEALKQLLKDTQALPQAFAVIEDEIAAEIAAYREGR